MARRKTEFFMLKAFILSLFCISVIALNEFAGQDILACIYSDDLMKFTTLLLKYYKMTSYTVFPSEFSSKLGFVNKNNIKASELWKHAASASGYYQHDCPVLI
jgi:hypothetical protein